MKKTLLVFSLILGSVFSYGQEDPFEKLMSNTELKPALELFFNGKVDSCIYILDQFDSTHIVYNEICFFKAQLYWENRDFVNLKQQIEVIYSRIDKKDNAYLSLLPQYGQSLRQTGNNEKAVAVFEEGYTITGDIIYLLNLLSLYDLLEKYERTIIYEKNISIDSSATLYRYLGVAY
ncbi:hypothetical protein OAU66_00695, partial [bacterium]|nr:hypothetical protein [bacterium]